MTRLIVADARKVTPAQFLDALGLSSPEERAERNRRLTQECIAAINRGDTYGWPPATVARCVEIIAEQDRLTEETRGDPLAKNRRAA